jgi:ATP-dependent DNA helicase RecG
MSLPINITKLIHGRSVEWERLEFKQGWNPEEVIHTMCAFANDLNNWGGGYVVIGIGESNGRPVLPPTGIAQSRLDDIQKEIIGLGNRIQPTYFPILQPYELEGKHILVLWCPAGDVRPYTAPVTLGEKAQRQSYVRVGSSSIIAKGEVRRRLFELTARIPFDDRINHLATIEDFDLGTIRAYLQEVKSDLFAESAKMELVDLCRTMMIVKGSAEYLRPVNVGLMFFCLQPERFFSRAWIEVVWHKDDSGTNFKETYFKGPLHIQLREALAYIRSNIIVEQVIKRSHKAEADRFYNYPYEAVEEALANAVYHKSYELVSPIEVQVFPDKILILSYPGPMPPVTAAIMKTQKHIPVREYRNRRIGDCLKELQLTEGRGTGFPNIYKAMAKNGSPEPVFETDELHYVLVTLPVHTEFEYQAREETTVGANEPSNENIFNGLNDLIGYSQQENVGAGNYQSNHQSNYQSNYQSNHQSNEIVRILEENLSEHAKDILFMVAEKPLSSADILEEFGLTKQTKNKKKYIIPLLSIGWLEYTIPENPRAKNQRYRTSVSGKRILSLMKKT